MVIGGVGVLTLTIRVLVKNVGSSEPSVHYDLQPGVWGDISSSPEADHQPESHKNIPRGH